MNENEKELTMEAPVHPDYAKAVAAVVHSKRTRDEKLELLKDFHESDIADALPLLTESERKTLFALIGEETASEIMAYVEEPAQYLKEIGVDAAADLLENMDADDAVDVLENLDDEHRLAILKEMDEEAREDVRLIGSYNEDEIGSRMTTNYIAIRLGLSKKQAMNELVEQAAENDNLSTLYVLDKQERFYGALTLQDLFTAKDDANLEQLITTSYPYVYDHESVEECIEQLKDYAEDSIPVLDSEKKLLGVITSQDIVEAVDDEMSEDYVKFAALTDEEDLKEPLKESLRKRVPWLLILMALGLVVSTVTGLFEAVMAQLTLVVAFQSLILDMAGNVGTQSLAVTIRVLSGENLPAGERLKLILKELRVGLCNGLVLGVLSFAFVGLYIHFLKGAELGFSFAVSGCLGLAMVLAMVISSFTGTAIPMFFKSIKVDPAVASGPLITTVNDLIAVVTYYGLAMLLLMPLVS